MKRPVRRRRALRLPWQWQHRQRRQPRNGPGLAEVPPSGRRSALHHHRTGRDNRQVRCSICAVGVAFVWSGRQPGDEASRKLLGRVIDVPRSYALAGSVDAIIVPGMGVLEETLGERPWGLPLGLFLMAAACRLRGRRFVLLDVGAECAANPVTRRLYVATVGLATHVSYRDQLVRRGDGPCRCSRSRGSRP